MSQNAQFTIKAVSTNGGISGSVIYPGPKGEFSTTFKLKKEQTQEQAVTLEFDPTKGKKMITIEIKRNGKGANSKEEFYIDICSPKGLDYTLTKIKDKCEIELKSIPEDIAQGAAVTVSDGKPG
ncbi:MAG: hypothetical protein JSV88_21105 [Candidatus Aminicenantes bacterium]|nr:MAG: hypothetical protein JSV88_21105 [Candidatus Aminicenantes bacterium]